MAAINQRIPNFLGGVSQQPDKIKFPGQLRVCDNAVPDVTFGLKKRPPAEFVGTLTNANTSGHWYDIIRDCLLYTSPSPRDATLSRMPSSA